MSKYDNLPLPTGLNCGEKPRKLGWCDRTEPSPTATETAAEARENIRQEAEARNTVLRRQRAEDYDNALGVRAMLMRTLTPLVTEEEVRAEQPYINPYPITFQEWGCNDLGELTAALQRNISRAEVEEMVFGGTFCGEPIEIKEEYKKILCQQWKI